MEGVSAKWSSGIVENWLLPQFKRGIVNIHHCSVMIALLSLCLVAPGQLDTQSHQDSGPGMNQTDGAVAGLHDFDSWLVNGKPIIKSLSSDSPIITSGLNSKARC